MAHGQYGEKARKIRSVVEDLWEVMTEEPSWGLPSVYSIHWCEQVRDQLTLRDVIIHILSSPLRFVDDVEKLSSTPCQ